MSVAWVDVAEGETYTPTSGDVGKVIRFRVTASNEAGEETAVSEPVLVVALVADRPPPGLVIDAEPARLRATNPTGKRVTLVVRAPAVARLRYARSGGSAGTVKVAAGRYGFYVRTGETIIVTAA